MNTNRTAYANARHAARRRPEGTHMVTALRNGAWVAASGALPLARAQRELNILTVRNPTVEYKLIAIER